MNVLLINPQLRGWSPNVHVPLGLTSIAAVLEQAGCDVEITDLCVEDVSIHKLQRKVINADIVGITGLITEYGKVVELVKIAKEASVATPVVLGGPLATTMPEDLLRMLPVDFVVVGEGERTVVSLLSALEHNSGFDSVRGIAYRDNGQVITTEPVEHIEDLDTIPFPARHLLDMKKYLKNCFKNFNIDTTGFRSVKSTNIVTSRGCPYSCTFCFKGMWGHKWRCRSPENIVEEIKLLYTTYGANGFHFFDEVFILDRERVFALCRLIRKEGLKIIWYCNCRADLVNAELLESMHDSGCRGVTYGIESGNLRVLKSMRKNITLDQVKKAVKWTKEAGISTNGLFMIGMLNETRATIEDTIQFARELDLPLSVFSHTTPYPGTELYSEALKAGLVSGDNTRIRDVDLNVNVNLTQDCSDDELIAFSHKAFREFNLRKRFGRYYLLRPHFIAESLKLLMRLQNWRQVLGLVRRVWSIVQ